MHDSDATTTEQILESNLKWRMNQGKTICEAAQKAIKKASLTAGCYTFQTSSSKWDNDPIRNAALHATLINQHLNASQCMTTTTSKGNIIYCYRAGGGKINDIELIKVLAD